jgi:cytoskeletal protein CcmA (bactofilin family)
MAGEGSAASIGKSVEIRGEVKGSEDLVIEGLVEGTVTLTGSRLTVGANAKVKANVSARDVIVLGSLHGNVDATGRIELRQGCTVHGDLRSSRLSIEENSDFRGKVDLVQSSTTAQNAQGQKPAAAPAPAAAGQGNPK